ncbi:MAG: hypothetical protein AUK08_03235 [Candidatus Pacebacteria bacterium CG2_30_36_39]|nr:MAG: hypothetical protein AUK08_03235 [Candidatus Pacebacteria bacterium CG2_30_36_39]
MNEITNQQLLDAIKDLKIINDGELQKFFTDAVKQKIYLGNLLLEKDIISEKNLGIVEAEILNLPFAELQYRNIEVKVREIIPLEVAKKQKAIAFKKDHDALSIAVRTKPNQTFLDFLNKKTGLKIKVFYTTNKDLENMFNSYIQDSDNEFEQILTRAKQTTYGTDEEHNSPPIIELVEKIISHADRNKASDIHIEPEDEKALVRLRIDGILQDILQIPLEVFSKVVMRLKIMSHLKTDEHQAAQDGKIQIKGEDEELDIRVSIVPVTDGEKVVMRLLSERSRKLSLTDLGIKEKDLEKISEAYKSSHGMILTTGPTGSGKTTSLYAILKNINTRKINIMTIEDPVEYDIEGVNQIQVNPKTNLTFAAGLRSIVRQDPDVVLVGEIRDDETADIAVNAAMTGHLVLSTLHTNDAATSLPRLIDMGVEPFLISSTIKVLIAQRLVRKICQACRVSQNIDKNDLKDTLPTSAITSLFENKDKKDVYIGKGCPVCHDTGYKDRIGIYEVMVLNEEIRDAIMERKDAEEIAQIAIKNGMTTMMDDGIEKVKEGITTIEEVLRVIKE